MTRPLGCQATADAADDIISLVGLTKRYEPTPRWMRLFARTHIEAPVSALDGVDMVVHAGKICYAAALAQRKSSSSIHMRWRVTAILRARATFARRDPWRLAIRTAHAFMADHLVGGRRTTFAASNSAVRASPSPTLLIRPMRSISPDLASRREPQIGANRP